ncbi:sensor histidine kinase [Pontibacter diazotrophicus]|nr:histidine kinase [Pontibacter diazotrophicus]
MIRLQSEKFYIRSLADFLSLNNFIWVFTIIVFGNLLSLSLKLFKNNYESHKRYALLQKQNAELELSFLRAQIHPHFLFNTLNNVYGLVMDNEKAAQVVLKLSDLLRFSLYESNRGFIPLKREVEFLSDYISLEQIRHSSRVSIQYCFSGIQDEEVKIAPLLLINFIENAFKHGINATRHRAWVRIRLTQDKDTTEFTVENSKPAKLEASSDFNEGIGLENVKRRLALQYPGKHRLKIKDTTDSFLVILTLQTNE